MQIVFHQCGFLGCRVCEASNPGPVETRQTRRMHADIVCGATQIDVSSEDEPIIRPNSGRDVIATTTSRVHQPSRASGIPRPDGGGFTESRQLPSQSDTFSQL